MKTHTLKLTDIGASELTIISEDPIYGALPTKKFSAKGLMLFSQGH